MSVTAMKYAFAAIQDNGPEMTPSAALILVALAYRHNQETGRFHTSLSTLCDMTGLSERAARNALRHLEKLKLIDNERGLVE